MKKLALTIGAICLLSLPGFAQNVKPKRDNPPKLNDADQVRLAVFRELLKPWLPEPSPNKSAYLAKAFYFSIEGKKDPSDQLIEALGKTRVPLRKASRSFVSDPDGSIVLDKKSRDRGILFLIYSLGWKGSDEVLVNAGNHEGNMSSFECTYTLRREGSDWQIVSSANCVIS